MTFQAWVKQLIGTRFGTATALANAVGMQLSPFTRGVAAGTLNLVNLLKLAKVAEEHPSTVLRLARKADEAALLEDLYGSGRDALPASLRELIETWEQIPVDVRGHYAVLLRHSRVIEEQRAKGETSPATPEPPRRRRRGGRAP